MSDQNPPRRRTTRRGAARSRARPEGGVRARAGVRREPDPADPRHQRADRGGRSPLNGAPLAHIPQSTPSTSRRRSARPARRSWPGAGQHRRAGAVPAPAARPDPRPPGRDHRPDRVGVRQGPEARVRRAAAHRADRPLLRAYGARAPRHPAQARRRPRPDPGRGQPGAQGRRRDHLALELPVHDGALRRHPGAARRQRGGRQAGRADHALRAARRAAARGGRLPQGPLAGRRRPRRRPRPGDHRPLRLRLLHRLDGHRQDHRQGLRREADRLLARARRQEPDPHPARRRPRQGGRGRRTSLLLERRPALRLDGADVRRRPGLRPVRRAVRGPHRGDDPRRDASTGATTWAR